MAAGVTDKLWEMSDIVKLVEQESSDNAYGSAAGTKAQRESARLGTLRPMA
jgi:hypothetical protein